MCDGEAGAIPLPRYFGALMGNKNLIFLRRDDLWPSGDVNWADVVWQLVDANWEDIDDNWEG